MTEFFTQLQDVSALHLALIGTLMITIWFLPAGLAMIFNRNQVRLITLACVPAGLSLFAWTAVLIWAVTGKAAEKYLPEKIRRRLA